MGNKKNTIFFLIVGILAILVFVIKKPILVKQNDIGPTTLKFIVLPDFLNADIEYGHPKWKPTLDFALKAISAENPEFVLIPGDLAMARWSIDASHIKKMASKYWGGWVQRMRAHGLKTYVSVGDHEIGDDPWDAHKTRLVATYYGEYRKYFPMPQNGPEGQKGLVYSFQEKGCQFIALNPFELLEKKTISVRIDKQQLSWLDELLGDIDTDCIFVYQHTPIFGNTPRRSSSGLVIENGLLSPLHDILKKHQVPFLLNGELHAFSAKKFGHLLQITSGSNLGSVPEIEYMIVEVGAKGYRFTKKNIDFIFHGKLSKQFDPYGVDPTKRRWGEIKKGATFRVTGTLVISRPILSNKGRYRLNGKFPVMSGVFQQMELIKDRGTFPLPSSPRDSGYAYIAKLPKLPHERKYQLILYEDDRLIGPGFQLHDDIRKKGSGRYSLWQGNLWFSASDNTNPNKNGRKYHYRLFEFRNYDESVLQ